MDLKKRIAHLSLGGLVVVAAAAIVGLTGLTGSGSASAQAPSCAAASNITGTWESGQTFGFVDVGEVNIATFVCINSGAFSGGQSPPFTSDGMYGDGCYTIDGLGTSVVSVFLEDPTGCPTTPSFVVGVGSTTTPTATATATATASPTQTATATATATQTATATSTASPTGTATSTATQAATPVPTKPPTAPSTGSGLANDGGSMLLPAALLFVAFAIASGAAFAVARRRF